MISLSLARVNFNSNSKPGQFKDDLKMTYGDKAVSVDNVFFLRNFGFLLNKF